MNKLEDFSIDIEINVNNTDTEDTHIKTLSASALTDKTLMMIMNDVENNLNNIKINE
tara:strand:- start:16296 stop:16466 length:171 start_codon:yes stop_codon:yes gene_type:complete